MRSAMARAGGDPQKIDPLVPVDLVIDHSVQVDAFGSGSAYGRNIEREYERNHERYSLFRWAQQAFNGFRVVPPGMGIVHQINLEYLARVVQLSQGDDRGGRRVALPDTLVGTDRTRRWSTASACSAGVSAASRPRQSCSDSRCSCSRPSWSACGSTTALLPGTTATDLVRRSPRCCESTVW